MSNATKQRELQPGHDATNGHKPGRLRRAWARLTDWDRSPILELLNIHDVGKIRLHWTNPDLAVHREAVKLLVESGEDAIPSIFSALSSERPNVRNVVADALWNLAVKNPGKMLEAIKLYQKSTENPEKNEATGFARKVAEELRLRCIERQQALEKDSA